MSLNIFINIFVVVILTTCTVSMLAGGGPSPVLPPLSHRLRDHARRGNIHRPGVSGKS